MIGIVDVKTWQLEHPLGERAQLLHHLGPRGQRRPARLIGEGDRDRRATDPGQRFDRVPFQRG